MSSTMIPSSKINFQSKPKFSSDHLEQIKIQNDFGEADKAYLGHPEGGIFLNHSTPQFVDKGLRTFILGKNHHFSDSIVGVNKVTIF
jgi:hypothetical protein